MIALLTGTIYKPTSMDSTDVIVNCHGVGYRVRVSRTEAASLPLGEETTLYIYTHVRPEELSLYGFSNYDDMTMFKLLLAVSGVGPKSALNIFDHGDSETITAAITTADVQFFTQISGLGKKTAQRIIIDLASKLKNLKQKELDLKATQDVDADAVSALLNLGFLKRDIVKVLREINQPKADSAQLVKLALKELSL